MIVYIYTAYMCVYIYIWENDNIFDLGVYVQTNPNIPPNILSCVAVLCHPVPVRY